MTGFGVIMHNKVVSSWIRQARYRAKRQNIHSDLDISDIISIINEFEGKCAYCSNQHDTLDHPFPIKDQAPSVAANILPICKACKKVKKNNDLVWMFLNNKIIKEEYLRLLKGLFSRGGGSMIKAHVKKLTGYEGSDIG